MRFATPQLVELLRSNTKLPKSDCFTLITVFGADIGELSSRALGNPVGQTYFYTNSDSPVQIGNHYFRSDGLIIKGVKYKLVRGLEVDEQSIEIHSNDTNTVNGVPFLKAVANGLLDGARFKQEKAFFDPSTWPARPGLPNKAVGSVTLFNGKISSIDDVGRTTARISVKSDLSLLDVDMPRSLYQPSCLNTLYDEGCGLKRTLFTNNAIVDATSTRSSIKWNNTLSANYYAQGVLRFSTGENKGVSRPIRASSTTDIDLIFPLPNVPAIGDEFIVHPGCDHTLGTCRDKFMNERNFRGYPYVPPPETAY